MLISWVRSLQITLQDGLFWKAVLCTANPFLLVGLLTEVTPADLVCLRATYFEVRSVLLTTYNYHD